MKFRPVSRHDVIVKPRPQSRIEPGVIFRLNNPHSQFNGGLVLIHDLHPSFPEREAMPDLVRAEYLRPEHNYQDDGLIWVEKTHLGMPTQAEIDTVLEVAQSLAA